MAIASCVSHENEASLMKLANKIVITLLCYPVYCYPLINELTLNPSIPVEQEDYHKK